MVTLTTFGKDNTKQVTNMSNAVLLDSKNKRMNEEQLNKKFGEIASTIGGKNYSSFQLQVI